MPDEGQTPVTPTPAMQAVTPVVKAMTGGNPDALDASVDQQSKTSDGYFANLTAVVQKVATQLDSAFQAGKTYVAQQIGGPQATADEAVATAKAQQSAILQAGQAGANVILDQATQKADAARATAGVAISLHLDPSDPVFQAQLASVNKAAEDAQKHADAIADMKKTGFFDNPTAYLMNHILNIPREESQREADIQSLGTAKDALDTKYDIIAKQTGVDSAIHYTDTTNVAANLYRQAVATAIQQGYDPNFKAQQIKLGAYNTEAEQARVELEAKNLQLQQFKAPYEIAESLARGSAYNEQAQAQAKLRTQQALDDLNKQKQSADTINAVNLMYNTFGLNGNITDLKQIPSDKLKPVLEISQNLALTGGARIAQDPATAWELLSNSKIPLNNMPDSHKLTMDALGKIHDQVLSQIRSTYAANPTMGPMPKGIELDDMVHKNMTDRIAKEQLNIGGEGNSFYKMPSLSVLLTNPKLQGNPVASAMIPLTLDGTGKPIQRDFDPKVMLSTAAQLVKDGKISKQQAIDSMGDIVTNGIDATQAAGGFNRFAIPYNPEALSSSVRAPGLNITGSHYTVNWKDSASKLTALNLELSALQNHIINQQRNPTTQTTPAHPKKLGKYDTMPEFPFKINPDRTLGIKP